MKNALSCPRSFQGVRNVRLTQPHWHACVGGFPDRAGPHGSVPAEFSRSRTLQTSPAPLRRIIERAVEHTNRKWASFGRRFAKTNPSNLSRRFQAQLSLSLLCISGRAFESRSNPERSHLCMPICGREQQSQLSARTLVMLGVHPTRPDRTTAPLFTNS